MTRRRTAALAAAPLLVTAACAVQPRLQEPTVERPPRYVAAADTSYVQEVPLDAFWVELGDTTLARLVSAALAANLDVRAAEARLANARADRQLAAFDYFPTVTAAAGYTRQRLSGQSFPGLPGASELDLYDAGVVGSWEIDVFGRIRGNVAGRSALERAAAEDVRDVRVVLVSEVGRVYYDLRGAQEQLAVAQRNAENQRRTLQLTQDRLEGGRGTAFDTERASAQLSATLARIPELETRIASDVHRIGVLLGRPPAALTGRLTVAAELPELPERPRVGTPEQLVRQRPDVRSAERRLAAETAFVGAARAEYFPRLEVGGNAGFTAEDFDGIGESETSRYAVGPALSWPLFDLGRVRARVSAARARAEEARAAYDQQVLLALEETETALVTYDRARARLELLRESAGASERAAELARLRFDEGVTDFLQVLDAERTLLEAQDELAIGQTNAVSAFVALYRALGGVWPLVTPEDPAREDDEGDGPAG
jgi:NodT family efflux transporter outer membrane factor (OMF) lipoprotein